MTHSASRLYLLGGVSGIVGTLCYVAAIALPLPDRATYIIAMVWPVFSVLFSFSLFRFIAADHQTAANQVAFIMSCLAFLIVACMISVQLAVRIGIDEHLATATDNQKETIAVMRRTVRLVDMGLDVAWDVFIGTALICLSVALTGHGRFGIWWGVPSALLGILLIALNVITFPWPPDTHGLVDVGPVIGLYIIALAIRLIQVRDGTFSHPKGD